MSLKRELITEISKNNMNITELCRRYQISRKTAYKWLRRYEEEGLEGLKERSRRPINNLNETSSEIKEAILEIRQRHPQWGGRKIKKVLENKKYKGVPSASTISKLLKKKGLIRESESSSRQKPERFEHEAPNHLWQIDFKGDFKYQDGRCHPLTLLDDHSRFSICLKACSNQTRETVQEYLIEIFMCYGLPDRINADNGHPWGCVIAYARYTSLSVWIIKIGVRVSYSRPGHPQTNGKLERFHRTLKHEVIVPHYFKSLPYIQRKFDKWREIYNYERPHEAIDMKVPAERYQASYRSYQGEIKDFDYAGDYEIKRTDSRGRIHLEGRQIFIGVPFAKELIGIRHTDQTDVVNIFFLHQKLGKINLSQIPKKTLTNLYSGRIAML